MNLIEQRSATKNERCLTEEQNRKNVYMLFDKYDLNKDELLNPKEVKKMLGLLYSKTRDQKRQITEEEVQNFIEYASQN